MTPMVRVADAPAPSMHLALLTDSANSPLLALRNDPVLARSILVVRNNSGRAILAISGKWKARDRSGIEKVWSQRCDVFLPAVAGKVIADPDSELYLGPVTCIAQRRPPVDLSLQIANMERGNVDVLGSAMQIEIAIDAVMFENGEMFAPDSTYAEDITARVSAARKVAARVREGLADGLSRQQIQQALSDDGRSMMGGQGAWFRDLGRSLFLQQGDRFDAYLGAMERLSLPAISMRTI